MREGDGQHRGGAGAVAERRAADAPIAHLGARARGARRAVMAVRNVERRNPGERRHERVAVRAGDAPDRVLHAVRGGEIDERRAADRPLGNAGDVALGAVGEEDRTRLRAEREHVARAVVFLVPPGALVLPDYARIVLVDREAGGDSRLHVAAHAEPVEVGARLVLDDERPVPQRRVILRRAAVDGVGVRIGVGRQLELGTRDANKAERVALGERARLVGRDHVVGNGRHRAGDVRRGTQRPERVERGHEGRIMPRCLRRTAEARMQQLRIWNLEFGIRRHDGDREFLIPNS